MYPHTHTHEEKKFGFLFLPPSRHRHTIPNNAVPYVVVAIYMYTVWSVGEKKKRKTGGVART